MAELPLKERVFHNRHPGSGRHGPLPNHRPLVYKNWDGNSIIKACDAIRNEGLSQTRAAEEYGIPRSTLGDYFRGRTFPGAKSGRMKYLTDAEEAELARFLIKCASLGFSKSRLDVIAMAQRVCDRKGLDVRVTHGWWESFSRRHPELVLRVPAKLSLARAKASDPEVISSYFDMLEKVLEEYELHDKPAQIFNIDETGMPLDHHPPKVICKKGMKNPSAITSGKKTQITVVGCVNAAGCCIPPMVIWNLKTMHPDMAVGEVRGTLHAFSENGWIDTELFNIWFNNLFLRYAPAVRPLLLLMDGHSTHYSPETIHLAAREKIVLFLFPPNTTHLSQPLDKGMFGPLKARYSQLCQEYLLKNPGKVINKFCFSRLFGSAWMQAMSMQNIQSGFQTTGVYPVDRNKLMPLNFMQELSQEDNGDELPFLPLLTPSHKSSSRKCSMKDPDKVAYDRSRNFTYSHAGRPLEDILKYPQPLHELPTVKPKKSSRVTTSGEEIRKMETKMAEKAQEAFRKTQNKYIRELKKGLAVPQDMQRLIESKSMLPGRGCKTQAKQAEIAPEALYDESSDTDHEDSFVNPLQLSLFDSSKRIGYSDSEDDLGETATLNGFEGYLWLDSNMHQYSDHQYSDDPESSVSDTRSATKSTRLTTRTVPKSTRASVKSGKAIKKVSTAATDDLSRDDPGSAVSGTSSATKSTRLTSRTVPKSTSESVKEAATDDLSRDDPESTVSRSAKSTRLTSSTVPKFTRISTAATDDLSRDDPGITVSGTSRSTKSTRLTSSTVPKATRASVKKAATDDLRRDDPGSTVSGTSRPAKSTRLIDSTVPKSTRASVKKTATDDLNRDDPGSTVSDTSRSPKSTRLTSSTVPKSTRASVKKAATDDLSRDDPGSTVCGTSRSAKSTRLTSSTVPKSTRASVKKVSTTATDDLSRDDPGSTVSGTSRPAKSTRLISSTVPKFTRASVKKAATDYLSRDDPGSTVSGTSSATKSTRLTSRTVPKSTSESVKEAASQDDPESTVSGTSRSAKSTRLTSSTVPKFTRASVTSGNAKKAATDDLSPDDLGSTVSGTSRSAKMKSTRLTSRTVPKTTSESVKEAATDDLSRDEPGSTVSGTSSATKSTRLTSNTKPKATGALVKSSKAKKGVNSLAIPKKPLFDCPYEVSSGDSQDEFEGNTDWASNLGLSSYEKEILGSKSWLSDNHINAANLLLRRLFPSQNGLQDTLHLIEKHQWRSTPKKFVQIVHVGGFHWACISNKLSPSASLIQVYDSLHMQPETTIKEQCCTILKCSDDSFTIQVMNVQIQGAGDTCGLFAIAMAFDLCCGRDPCSISYDESAMRAHLQCCFGKQVLSHFPRSNTNNNYPNKRRVVNEVKVPVYCSCRYPDVDVTSRFGDMAQCDGCSKWYHQQCQRIPKAVFDEKQKFWFCTSCA